MLHIFALVFICFFFLPIAISSIIAAPPLGTKRKDVARLVKLANISESDIVYDLGAGDGRLLLAVARQSNAQHITGFELSPFHIIQTRIRLWRHGLTQRIKIKAKDFYRQDLGQADVILCFLTPKAMQSLKPKFDKELKPGTRVVSYVFPIPGLEPGQINRPSEEHLPIYLYTY